MSQTVKCYLFLYADDSCLLCQHKDIIEIEKQLNVDFSNIRNWFVDIGLWISIHLGEDIHKIKDRIKFLSCKNIFKHQS